MAMLRFMGTGEPEEVRCRVYDGGTSESKDKRVAFLRACAGPGAVDCPAYDGWVAALQARRWLPPKPDLEPNPDGEGQIGRWRLTEVGRQAWSEIERTMAR